MNGEIPSVPITTLAGVSSLTDLLPEMPLPSPLPQTLSNKSLLFHPRVAEEAQILLSHPNDLLIPQLVNSLQQTSSEHIELKDQYLGTELQIEQQNDTPALLKAILAKNPTAFKGSGRGYVHWRPHTFGARGHGRGIAQHGAPQQTQPAQHLHPLPTQRPSVITVPAKAEVPDEPGFSPDPGSGTEGTDGGGLVRDTMSSMPSVANVMRHFRPNKASDQQQPIHAGFSPAQASVAPEEATASMNHAGRKENFANGTSSGQPRNETMQSVGQTRSEPMGKNETFGNFKAQSSAVPRTEISMGPSSAERKTEGKINCENKVEDSANCKVQNASPSSIDSNITSIAAAIKVEGESGGLAPILNFITGEIEYKPCESPLPDQKDGLIKVDLLGPMDGDIFSEKGKKGKSDQNIKPLVVVLNRLSEKDQVLMQKSLSEFAQKQPDLANKLGIQEEQKRRQQHQNHRRARGATIIESDSEASETENTPVSRIFKSRDRARRDKRKHDKLYIPPSFEDGEERYSKRKRNSFDDDDSSVEMPKPKVRKVERKLVPVLEKLSVEELMETNTYQRFNTTIDRIFDNTDDLDFTKDQEDGEDVPPEVLIPKYQLQDLCAEAAKLKTLGAMESIPTTRLVKLLNILEMNIRDGARVSPIADPDDDDEETRLWVELVMERVMRAMDASLTAILILTSPNMPKRVYLEDVIDRIVLFTKFQLSNTIYPAFDPVYRIHKKGKDGYTGSVRKKGRSHNHPVKEKSVLTLYTKLHSLVGLLAELLNVQVLTDTTVLHASSMAVSPFFVEEVSELQLSALKLVTTIFTKYEKHRRLLLDDILASIARLPSSKRSLRTYRLNSEQHIQMLTALVLQLIQCVVILPDSLYKAKTKNDKDSEQSAKDKIQMDRDVQIVSKYETALKIAGNFLSVFLSKCGSKSEEIDYRPLFENFVQDLLTTVNKPEWPATEILLSLLGKLLVGNLMNKGTDMSLRVASLDYLGVVAARLRKDFVTSHRKLASIDEMIAEIKAAEGNDSILDEKPNKKTEEVDPEEERTQFLQRVLLDYLALNGQSDPAWTYARHFYLSQWYHDCMTSKPKPTNSPNKQKRKRKKRKSESSAEEISDASDEDEVVLSEAHAAARFQMMEARKQFLLSKVRPFGDESGRGNVLETYIDYDSADLISRYLASKRPFSLSFDGYLKQILRVLAETSIAIRTKAIKCLTMVVDADPSVLGMKSMQMGVRVSFLDHATSVREAAVDLVGKFVLSRPELIHKYYDMLSARILDTGVSVRKRVIKILRDICMECPEFDKIPEICVKMIRRVKDEEGIRKLVMEVFQNMWFTPVRERPLDTNALLRKVINITQVVASSSKDMGLEWFETLLASLFKPKEDKEDSTKIVMEPPKALMTACTQIVDCLIENVLKLEEGAGGGGSSQRLVACLTTLYLFAKIRPQLLVGHAITLQPYLSLKCQTHGDYQIVSNVARTLELIVPLMEHPSETFLAQLEEDSVKLILQHDPIVVASCLSCLGSIVNNVTRNFKLIRDCFHKYYGYLLKLREQMMKDMSLMQLEAVRPYCKRALFTVGLLMRHFDFTDAAVRDDLSPDLKDEVFSTLFFFVHHVSADIQNYTMKAIGSLCIRHYDLMLGSDLKGLYYRLLTEPDAPLTMRAQVLHNIEMYLQEEETRMIKQDQEWAKRSKTENLKEMGDVSSGMASTVIQLYIKEILDAFLHRDVTVRKAALKVIQLILQQGLVHPVQIVPYLICMSTDVEKIVSHSADKHLQEIEKKYPGFIHMKAQLGIRLSYKFQRILQGQEIVRGFRLMEGELPGALNGFLYSILRSTKQQRRAIVLSVLKQFDEQVKTSLAQMLYLADNLAYFPYQVVDEPLFIVHHIDVMISMSGTNLLQSFREALIPSANQQTRQNPETGNLEVLYDEEEDEDCDSLVARVPEDTTFLQECVTASQGCLLLLVLKQHLKDLYGLTDAKIAQYSPSESAKIYEKAVNRKSQNNFNPKGTLTKLQEGEPPPRLDQAQRRELINQYLVFKQLMLKFDPDEEDDEGGGGAVPGGGGGVAVDGMPPPPPSNAHNTSNPADRGNFPYTQQDTRDVTPGKVPKITIVTPRPPDKESLRSHRHKPHKADRQKRHRHKKRKKYGSDDEDDDGASDPDFLV